MPCCEQKKQLDSIYLPLSTRLIEFGKEACGELMNSYPSTFLWIFTFCSDNELKCEDCQFKFSAMNKWFCNYGMLTDPIRNVKWVIEDNPIKNFIYTEMGFTKLPMHIFTDKKGRIIDIVMGFPSEKWLEKHILPLFQTDVNIYE